MGTKAWRVLDLECWFFSEGFLGGQVLRSALIGFLAVGIARRLKRHPACREHSSRALTSDGRPDRQIGIEELVTVSDMVIICNLWP